MRKLGVVFGIVWLVVAILPIQSVMGQGNGGPLAPPDGTDLPLDEIAYQADFSDSTQWPEGSGESIDVSPTANGYQVTSPDPDAGIGLAPQVNLLIDNFYAEISFTIDTCQVPESAVLFLARLTPNAAAAAQLDTYAFVLQCSGDYRSRSITAGVPGEIDVQGRTGAALDEGSQHHLGVLMVNNSVTWYLDGVELVTLDVLSPLRVDGVLAIGAQRGLGYTATALTVWSLDSTIVNTIPAVVTGGTTDGEDPLSESGVGSLIYSPDLGQPGSLPTGLNQPVATLYIGGSQVGMYNRADSAIMPFEDESGELVQGSDYYLEIVFATRACSDASVVGLVWRADTEFGSYYAFGVRCDGSYQAWLETPDGPGAPFASGQVSFPPEANSGGHTLGVYVEGDTAWLYYDDVAIGSFSDASLMEGAMGLLLQSDPETDKAMDIVAASLTVAEIR